MSTEFINILLMISVLVNAGSVIAMLCIYRSMEESMDTLISCLYKLLNNHRSEHGTGIPGMAEDTKVAE